MCGAPASTEATRCEHCGARLATVACPSCFGMMFIGQKFCPHCGARADRKETEAAKLMCPRCGVRMNEVTLGQTSLFECAKCEGIWADKVSLEEICADRERQAAVLGMPTQLNTDLVGQVESKIRYVPCPVCNKLMNRVNFAKCSHVVVDVCSQHGTWFDKDELRRIVEFIRAGGLDLAREREIAALEQQRRALQAAKTAGGWDERISGSESGPSLLNVLLG
jgi:Zn-finger nucleic acid-binding protein